MIYVTRLRYLLYMKTRWPDKAEERMKCVTGYAEEWAIRFKHHIEYDMSDGEGRKVLQGIDEGNTFCAEGGDKSSD